MGLTHELHTTQSTQSKRQPPVKCSGWVATTPSNPDRHTAFDEGRVAQLLRDLSDCPDYQTCVEEEERAWDRRSVTYCQACRELMRGYIPPHIASATKAQLVSEGINETLAARLLARRCLWLVRMLPEQIDRLTERDLAGRYSTHGQGPLDMVELAAIYACVSAWPAASDAGPPAQQSHRALFRAAWRARVEAQMKNLSRDEEKGVLGKRARHPAYLGQEPRYVERKSLPPQNPDRGLFGWRFGPTTPWRTSRSSITPADDVDVEVARNPMAPDPIPRPEGRALSYRHSSAPNSLNSK